ncbi:Protein VARIATION IN COMPOUND TRIGGERED ROOT growth response [Cardamine amara subsp. amara]|uniref:ADP-ribosyl cyclase/cyclic ADP-ribose hydrolase n=1 Tax=Cardamine amara subsp. amara TaxID=228776 RepID=A0ABD1C2U1_CARAN
MASSSSSLNWLYDVFVSFRGEDVRITFLSHFFKELDRKLITAFKDNEIKKSRSLWPELVQAIWSSRIAVVVFSKNYASSSWCLNELLEIVNCKDKIVIPIFFGVDPSHVRKQAEDFGKIFKETCKNNTKEVKDRWKKTLTDVANMLGFDSAKWANEAKMIEEITNDVLRKLLSTSSKDFENFVGIEDHMAKMSELLQLESEEVRMVGIWGSSGIGKTIIARALFNQLPQHFQGSIFIDRAFVSKSKEIYRSANPDDHNMKLHLQKKFLSKILGIKAIKIDHLSAVEQKLKCLKVLIIIDDLDDRVVLDSLVGQTQWFGSGSRIIVVTNDKHFLRAHGIHHIYEVSLPTVERALEMLCQSAFRKKSPPESFEKLVVDVVRHAGSLPLGLNVLGSNLRGRDKEYWMEMLLRLQNGLDDKIEKVLRVSYDGLGKEEDKAIFRHIACLFNHVKLKGIKLLLEGVNIGLEHLVDKSLIHVSQGRVVMHCLLQEMGRIIVRTQSIDKPEKREFLVDSKDICYVLSEGTGTHKVVGISLDTREIDELHIHENAFKGMRNLRFLDFGFCYFQDKCPLHLPESFDYLPPRLKLLCWPNYPMSSMPSNFHPKTLVKLKMQCSKLEKLWEGVVSLPCLKEMDLMGSHNLKEIPDLSMATNLEKLDFEHCWSLVELPSSIRNLNKLLKLNMGNCSSLETLPTGFDLKSLDNLNFTKCQELRTFPEFSTNISVLHLYQTNIEEFPCNLHLENLVDLGISKEESDGKQWEGVKPLRPFLAMLSPTLTKLELEYIPSLVEIPSSFQNLNHLKKLSISYCRNLETLPTGINLRSLNRLDLCGCSGLRSFPEISTNISRLDLDETGIEEVPWRIEKFSNLYYLSMRDCKRLKCVSLHISKLKHLEKVYFSDCVALARVDLSGYPSGEEMEEDNIDKSYPEEASSSLSDDSDDYDKVDLNFTNCFNLDTETLLEQQSIIFKYMVFPGEEVPSYFTHRTSGTSSSLTIPLHTPLFQPFFRFRACAVVNVCFVCYIKVYCQFKGRFWNCFDYIVRPDSLLITRKGSHLLIFDCCIPLNEDIAPLAQRNYDHVEMQIHASNDGYYTFQLKGWGIRLLEEYCSSPENRLGYPNTLPHDCEANEDNMGYMPLQRLVNETEHNEESGDSNVETERCRKRMRLYNFI